MTVDVDVRFEDHTIKGAVVHTVAAIEDGLREVRLDAEGLTIDGADVGGARAAFRVEAAAVVVLLPHALRAGETAEVAIRYHGRPRRGMHWVEPAAGYPDRPREVWTHGQPAENHFWVPLWDAPNQRATWDTAITVPEGLRAVSNGVLVAEDAGPRPGTRTFRFRMDQANATYLLGFAAGPWEVHRDRHGDVPLEVYVPRGTDDATVRRSFAHVPAMMSFFEERVGIPYPWPVYRQTTVAEFESNGMEDVSATLLSDETLHDERAHLDEDSDRLVAHELAHQWWGDLVTCRSWAHLWLNEGFATYFAALWREHERGTAFFRADMRRHARTALDLDDPDDPRPLVESFLARPAEGRPLATGVYSRGASVLHMLRFVLGDERFFAALRLYARRNAGKDVTTDDLRAAVAAATGDPLDWFFDEWVYGAGHPVLEVTHRFDARSKRLTLAIEQRQRTGGLVPLFRMPVAVEIATGGGTVRQRVWVTGRRNVFTLPLPAAPRFVRIDDGGWLLAEIRQPHTDAEWLAQLREDDDPLGRVEALAGLGRPDVGKAGAAAVAEVALDAREDPVVRAAAARALETLPREAGVRTTLLAALDDADARVRAEAARALGGFGRDEDAARKLEAAARGDPSYATASAAVRALGRALGRTGWQRLLALADVPSFRDVVRGAVFDTLAGLDAARALPLLVAEASRGPSPSAREEALQALGRSAPSLDAAGRKRARAAIAHILDGERSTAIRIAALRALGVSGDPAAAPLLMRASAQDESYLSRDAARTALAKLGARSGVAEPRSAAAGLRNSRPRPPSTGSGQTRSRPRTRVHAGRRATARIPATRVR